MKRYIPSALVFLGILGLIIAAAISDGGTGTLSASLIGLAGIISMTVGARWENRIEEDKLIAKQEANYKDIIVALHRNEIKEQIQREADDGK